MRDRRAAPFRKCGRACDALLQSGAAGAAGRDLRQGTASGEAICAEAGRAARAGFRRIGYTPRPP